MAASLGLLDGRAPEFEPAAAVSGAGVLTALPALLGQGLLRHAGLLALPKGYYGLPSLLLLWACLLLGRVRTAEALRYQQPGEWGALLGLDRCPCARTLRRRTRQLAAAEGLADWIGQLSQAWCADDPDAVATLYVDGHVQVYSGQGRLPKHFVSRQRLALPAAVSYWVHALGGTPLLCLHRPVDAGLVREIWQGIVPQLRQLGLLPEGAGAADEPSLTLVFDREGWSPALFRELRKVGIAVVSWRKGKQAERWPESEFAEVAIPLAHAVGRGHAGGPPGRAQGELGGALPRARDPFLGRAPPARHGQGRPAAPAARIGRATGRDTTPAGAGDHASQLGGRAGGGPVAVALESGEFLQVHAQRVRPRQPARARAGGGGARHLGGQPGLASD